MNDTGQWISRAILRSSAAAIIALCWLVATRADDFRISEAQIAPDGAFAVVVPGSQTNYYVLSRSAKVEWLNRTQSVAVGAVPGTNSSLIVPESWVLPEEAGFYIVEQVPLSDAMARDSDGDGIADDFELAHPEVLSAGNWTDAGRDSFRRFVSNLDWYLGQKDPLLAYRALTVWPSREIVVHVDGAAGFRNIESREIVVHVDRRPDFKEVDSREIAIFIDQKPGFKGGISREISVLVQ